MIVICNSLIRCGMSMLEPEDILIGERLLHSIHRPTQLVVLKMLGRCIEAHGDKSIFQELYFRVSTIAAIYVLKLLKRLVLL